MFCWKNGDGEDADDLVFDYDNTLAGRDVSNLAVVGETLTYTGQQTRLRRGAAPSAEELETDEVQEEEEEEIYSCSSSENDEDVDLDFEDDD